MIVRISSSEWSRPRARTIVSHQDRSQISAHSEASLCQAEISGCGRARRGWTSGGEGLGVLALDVGSGGDLSEEPVFQGVSRPRWIKESSLVVLPDPLFCLADALFGVGDEVPVDDV